VKTIATKRHKRLIELLITERKTHGLRQEQLAHVLRKQQAWISRIEGGDRRVDVIEFLDLADGIGFDPFIALAAIREVGPDKPLRTARAPASSKPANRPRRRGAKK
jgi:transcriptional regulator with XRE-family HTH domain